MHHIQRFLLVYFTSNQQQRIIRLIIFPVKCLQTFNRRFFDIRFFADGGMTIVVKIEGTGHHTFVQHATGVVFTRFVLVAHHTEFTFQVFAGNVGIDHTVAFQVERPAQVDVGSIKSFEIVGAVERCGAVGSRTVFGEFLRDIGMFGRPFKNEVFEQVRHTCFAIIFVPGAYFVGDINGNNRLRLVWKQ